MFFNQILTGRILQGWEGSEEQSFLGNEDDMGVRVSRQKVGNGLNQQLMELL